MPTPANRQARQRAGLAIVIALLLAGGIALLLLPMKFPLILRLLLAGGDFTVAMILFTLLKQRPADPSRR